MMKLPKHFSDDWIGPEKGTSVNFSVDNLVQGSDLIVRFRERSNRWVLTNSGWLEVPHNLSGSKLAIKLMTK